MALESDANGNMRVNSGPARKLALVTPSDTEDLPGGPCRSLWIGIAGAVTVIAENDETGVELTNVPVGLLPVAAKRVTTATTAGEIVALY